MHRHTFPWEIWLFLIQVTQELWNTQVTSTTVDTRDSTGLQGFSPLTLWQKYRIGQKHRGCECRIRKETIETETGLFLLPTFLWVHLFFHDQHQQTTHHTQSTPYLCHLWLCKSGCIPWSVPKKTSSPIWNLHLPKPEPRRALASLLCLQGIFGGFWDYFRLCCVVRSKAHLAIPCNSAGPGLEDCGEQMPWLCRAIYTLGQGHFHSSRPANRTTQHPRFPRARPQVP